MARSLDALADAEIRALVGTRAYELGRALAEAGRVTGLTRDAASGEISGLVKGTMPAPYQVLVAPKGKGVAGHCSCPVAFDCKHVAALLLAARTGPAGSSWQRSLAAVVETVPASRGKPLALLVDAVATPAVGQRTRQELRLRPLCQGAKGQWVKTGVSWLDLRRTDLLGRYDKAQREALRDIAQAHAAVSGAYYYGSSSSSIRVTDFGPTALRLLQRAAARGVALVDDRLRPVALAESAPVALDLADEDGAIRLQPVLQHAAGGVPLSELDLVGEPPVGAFSHDPRVVAALAPDQQDASLVVVPFPEQLDDRLRELWRATEPLTIPATESAAFFSGYYPALRQVAPLVSRDGSVSPPEVEPPVLALTIAWSGLEADLAWGFEYRVGDAVTRVPLTGAASGVSRDLDEEHRVLDALSDRVQRFLDMPPHVRDMDAVELVQEVLPLLRSSGVRLTELGERPDFRPVTLPPVIGITAEETGRHRDWYDLAVTVSVDGEVVPFDKLFRSLVQGRTHLMLEGGSYLDLRRPELETLRELIEEAERVQDRTSENLSLSVYQVGLWQELLRLGIVQSQSERWNTAVRGLLELPDAPPPPEPPGLQAELRPYQRAGFQWLAFLWQHQLGGILADDMGLGKTLQTLALVLHARAASPAGGPFLVVAPTSVVAGWAREAARFAPGLDVRTVTATTSKRRVPLAEDIAGADVVVTSYTLLRIDEPSYSALDWAGLVLDEAQYVKNPRGRTYAAARKISAPFRLAVTGTPLENSLLDLWSLLSIAAPGLYPDHEVFTEIYQRPIERGNHPELLAQLHRRVRPLMLRRTKEQVASELPPKQEQILDVPLEPKHFRVYQAHLNRERRKVMGLLHDFKRNRFEILKSLTMLRQLALAPELVDPEYTGLPSSKIEVLLEQLVEVVAEGHQVLVFSQFTRFLQLVRTRLDSAGIRSAYLDGRTRDREAPIAEFSSGAASVFLISLKAGGVGLNLTAADYVYILDPWWNPAVEAQAVDRAHRIGQDKPVMVYRLVATGTIEEKVQDLKAKKEALFRQVVDDDGAVSGPLTADDVRGLLG